MVRDILERLRRLRPAGLRTSALVPIKHFYYRLQKPRLKNLEELKLGYVIHTERIHETACFERLIRFCKDYFELTGRKVICTVIPPHCPFIQTGLLEAGVGRQEFDERAHKLAEAATIGYHGHFWVDTEAVYELSKMYGAKIPQDDLKINGPEHYPELITQQLERDLNWFSEVGLSHHGLYAAGWWYMHADIIKKLIANNFRFDFSFSRNRYCQTLFTSQVLSENGISGGEIFELKLSTGSGTLTCVQTLTGANNSSFPEDMARFIRAVVPQKQRSAIGVIASHDFDLMPHYTIQAIQFLKETWGATFFDERDLYPNRSGSRVVVLTEF